MFRGAGSKGRVEQKGVCRDDRGARRHRHGRTAVLLCETKGKLRRMHIRGRVHTPQHERRPGLSDEGRVRQQLPRPGLGVRHGLGRCQRQRQPRQL